MEFFRGLVRKIGQKTPAGGSAQKLDSTIATQPSVQRQIDRWYDFREIEDPDLRDVLSRASNRLGWERERFSNSDVLSIIYGTVTLDSFPYVLSASLRRSEVLPYTYGRESQSRVFYKRGAALAMVAIAWEKKFQEKKGHIKPRLNVVVGQAKLKLRNTPIANEITLPNAEKGRTSHRPIPAETKREAHRKTDVPSIRCARLGQATIVNQSIKPPMETSSIQQKQKQVESEAKTKDPKIARAEAVLAYLAKIPPEDRKEALAWTREKLAEQVAQIPRTLDSASFRQLPESIQKIIVRIAELKASRFTDPSRVIENVANLRLIREAGVTLEFLNQRQDIDNVGLLLDRLEIRFKADLQPSKVDNSII